MIKFSPLAESVFRNKYAISSTETWEQCAERVASNVMSAVPAKVDLIERVTNLIKERKFIPGGRYLFSAGREWHQCQNCLMLRAEDSSEGWADLMYKATSALMSGAGIGVDYSALRPKGAKIVRKGGESTGPLALMKMVNESGREIQQGGTRRSAVWAGLNWSHSDIFDFITMKNWSEDVKKLKEKDFNFPAPMDGTNISVILDKAFFIAYAESFDPLHDHAQKVYDLVCRQMVTTAEPGFSIDYNNPRESLRNACCELTSEDDSDICNIGSLNIAAFSDVNEFGTAVRDATAFLLAGTAYSDVPYKKVDLIRTKNRRLGLGIMGIAEWLLQRNKPFDIDSELDSWLWAYSNSSSHASRDFATEWYLSTPLKVRAIAPTGSIGILAECTTGLEPIYCVSYKRRYLKNAVWHYQYVVDPSAKRLIDSGVRPENIEDALSLAKDPMRRIRFQAWVQRYVDHGISSTVNLPAWGSAYNNEKTLSALKNDLLPVLRDLRGITFYPDGARAGQPIVAVPYAEAANSTGVELIEEYTDMCSINKGGSCGS